VGTSVLDSMAKDPDVTSVLGLSRRRPQLTWPKTELVAADITKDDLVSRFEGADAVIHLAWLIQPSRNVELLRQTNVDGSRRVFRAAVDAGVRILVYGSSIGAYSPGSKDRAVDESWPTNGTPSSFYARHKAEVERSLDEFEQNHPNVRVVRLRPALIFKREAASEIRRLFAGPFLPSSVLRRTLIPVFPIAPGLSFQCVHSSDVGEAYRLAVTKDVSGAFNIAADPVIDAGKLSEILRARPLTVPMQALRLGTAVTWRLRLQPTPEGWVDMGLSVPTIDSTRARTELGWAPRFSSVQALEALLDGLRTGAGIETAPLTSSAGGPLRIREIIQGVGKRSGL
jgi:UDP-glucose 4-epimerase